jgi:hypothetical protein
MNLFSFNSRCQPGNRCPAASPGGPAGLKMHDLTCEHIAVLAEINSPWIHVFLFKGTPVENIRAALHDVTQDQIAEFMFVMSRPGLDSKNLLATKGRSELTRAAISFVLRQVPASVLEALAADGGKLTVEATMKSLTGLSKS